MKKIRICVLALAVVASGSRFAMAQAPAGEAPKKDHAPEQGVAREIYGKIQSIKGTMVTLQTRTGTLVQVDAKPAIAAERSVTLIVGHAIDVKGMVDKAGVLHAEILQKAKDSPAIWPADR
jgi:hypothetical protein